MVSIFSRKKVAPAPAPPRNSLDQSPELPKFGIVTRFTANKKILNDSKKRWFLKVNSINQDGDTPLLYAVKNNEDIGIIETLLFKGADLMTKDRQDKTALMIAAKTDIRMEPAILKYKLDVVYLLLKYTPYNPSNKDYLTRALCETKDIKIARLLIKRGAQVNNTGDCNLLEHASDDMVNLFVLNGLKPTVTILERINVTRVFYNLLIRVDLNNPQFLSVFKEQLNRYNYSNCIKMIEQSHGITTQTLKKAYYLLDTDNSSEKMVTDSILARLGRSHSLSRSSEFGESLPKAATSNEDCYELLSRVSEYFSPFANKLIKMCTKIHDKSDCTSQRFEKALQNLHEKVYAGITPHVFTFQNVKEGSEFNYIMDFRQLNVEFITLCKTPFKYGSKYNFFVIYIINEIAYEDMGQGPVRQFFSNVAKQMLKSKYFKKVGDSYTLNPGYDASIYERLGSLTALLMLNEFKFKHHLCRSLLASLLYNPSKIHPDEYALYHILDYPSLVVLLKNPHTIQDAYLEFKDQTKVTKANFMQYLQEQGRPDQDCISAFRKGFFIPASLLRRNNISLVQLDLLLTGSEISQESIDKIVIKVKQSIESSPYKLADHPCLDHFIYILESPAEAYPHISDSQHNLPKSKSEFMEKLLIYWTGMRTYSDKLNYSIIPSIGTSFLAHTCVPILYIPDKYDKADKADDATRKDMYIWLIRTVTVVNGFAP
jgi:hypothetical protein